MAYIHDIIARAEKKINDAVSAIKVHVIDSSGSSVQPATSTAQTDGSQKTQIVDAGGVTVLPATSTKQDSLIILATQLETLIETLQELVGRLAPLASAVTQVGGQSLRVTGLAMPSTAVTGPITSAQSIAEKQLGGTSYPEKVAVTNLTAIQSNINNAVAN